MLVDGNLSYGFRNSSDDRGDAETMNDKEKLERINEIARLTWDWLCENPIIEFVTPIGRIIGLSSFEDCFGTESCNVAEYIDCKRADACSEQAEKNKNV